MSWAGLVEETSRDTHPPFYYALLKVWFALTPSTLFSAKVLSVLFSAMTMVVTFFFTRRMFGREAGWVALVTMAVAPYQVFWSHVARMHQLMPLLVIAIIWLGYRWVEERRARDWWLLLVMWVLAVQTNYMAFPFAMVWALAMLVECGRDGRATAWLAVASGVGFVLFVPWLAVLWWQMREGPMNASFFQETVSPIYLYYHALFGTMEPYQPNQSGPLFLLAMGVFVAAFIAAGYKVQRRWSLWILLLLGPTVPIVLAWWREWTLAERHLLFMLPLFNAYWGAGVVVLWTKVRRKKSEE
jgi:uncharacterized membrane protein